MKRIRAELSIYTYRPITEHTTLLTNIQRRIPEMAFSPLRISVSHRFTMGWNQSADTQNLDILKIATEEMAKYLGYNQTHRLIDHTGKEKVEEYFKDLFPGRKQEFFKASIDADYSVSNQWLYHAINLSESEMAYFKLIYPNGFIL